MSARFDGSTVFHLATRAMVNKAQLLTRVQDRHAQQVLFGHLAHGALTPAHVEDKTPDTGSSSSSLKRSDLRSFLTYRGGLDPPVVWGACLPTSPKNYNSQHPRHGLNFNQSKHCRIQKCDSPSCAPHPPPPTPMRLNTLHTQHFGGGVGSAQKQKQLDQHSSRRKIPTRIPLNLVWVPGHGAFPAPGIQLQPPPLPPKCRLKTEGHIYEAHTAHSRR